jgi:hypothetical protein
MNKVIVAIIIVWTFVLAKSAFRSQENNKILHG